ncbi:MAG: hypothetical protein M3042_00445 [Actinomycetota bacterium]|nr:hypothetical protein [Actinomycetota bacterium]
MPSGAYRHEDGTVEEFQCAAGPAGWRYVSTTPAGRLDLAVDSRWRQARVEVRAGGWQLRGGVAGPDTVWLRTGAGGDPADAREHRAGAAGFTGRSPALLIATARSLRLAVGERVRIRLVALTEPVLATRLVDQEWLLHDVAEHAADAGAVPVEHYGIGDLSTGVSTELYLCGDVAVSGTGIELVELHTPPTGV